MVRWFDSGRTLHVFLSYTSREEEVRAVQPLVDLYCRELWQRARSNGLDVFYDHFSLEQRWYSDEELEALLDYHIAKASMFVGFISPAYVESRWCCHEWRNGPMGPGGLIGLRRLPTQSIYWKPDYHEPTPYAHDIVQDLDSRDHTDVTLAYGRPDRTPAAAQSAASVGAQLLFSKARR
jgi:TIR domain